MHSWPDVLFVENAELFLPLLERENLDVEKEIQGVCSILRDFNINPNSNILDLACGIGRHSISLASRGYNVVGVDKSPCYLSIANQKLKQNPSLISKLKFVRSDVIHILRNTTMKKLSKFDVIISMCQSIGYYGPLYDEKVFSNLTQISSNNCTLIVEVENRDWRVSNFDRFIIYDFERSQIQEQWILDLETSTAQSHVMFYEKVTDTRVLKHIKSVDIRIRLYSLHELKELLERSGWIYLTSYGNIKTLEPLSVNSEFIVAIFKKRNSSS